MRPSYLNNGNPFTAKMASLHWNGPLSINFSVSDNFDLVKIEIKPFESFSLTGGAAA